jgi:hypothetical protein
MSATPTPETASPAAPTETYDGADQAAVRRAISTTPRPARASAASTALTFGWRGMLKVKHVPEQLLDVTITPVMFVLMFTYLFGGAIAGSTAAYLDYILPGILVMSVLFTTVYSGVALNTDRTKGVVDRFRSLPVWRSAPLVGSLLGDAVRYVIAGTVIIVLGLVLGFRPGAGAGGVLAALALVVVFSFGPVLGLHDPRSAPAHAERRHERRLHGHLPAHVPVQRVRRPGDPAGAAAGLRRRQPDLAARHLLARPHGGRRRRQRPRRRAGGRGGPHRRLRAPDDLAVPAQLTAFWASRPQRPEHGHIGLWQPTVAVRMLTS